MIYKVNNMERTIIYRTQRTVTDVRTKGTKGKHRRVLYWLKSYDMRLDEAIHRLPKYTQALLDAVEAKRMEIKRLHKMLER